MHKGEHVRVFPISNWTELDVWQYIVQENTGRAVDLLRARAAGGAPPRRAGAGHRADARRGRVKSVEDVSVRFRTVGDITCTAPVASVAATGAAIIVETAGATITERGATRLDDQTNDASMELRKKAGYF